MDSQKGGTLMKPQTNVRRVELKFLLTEEDCGTIADFLESHSYRNDPELTESDVAPILDRVEAVLAEYHSAG